MTTSRNNEQKGTTPANSEDNPAVSLENSPDFEKNLIPASIRKIDFSNPSEKDISTLADITTSCFLEKYGKYEGIAENAEKFKTSFSFLDKEQYLKAIETEKNLDSVGAYVLGKHQVFIDKESMHKDPDFDFTTFLHEAYHFFSIENGAGYSLDSSMGFTVSEKINDDPELSQLLVDGTNALCEGATQSLAVNMHHDLGFAHYNNAYPLESTLANSIAYIVGEEKFEEAFFTMPLEEVRLRFESLAVPEGEEIEEDYANGAFGSCLVNLGICINYCNNILKKYEDSDNDDEMSDEDKDTIYHAIEDFSKQLYEYVHQHNTDL